MIASAHPEASVGGVEILVLSNDVVPGFGVPVAAPGLRADGVAQGLRQNGFDVEVLVPTDVLRLAGPATLNPPGGVSAVEPTELMTFIEGHRANVVVFINANLTPHLRPLPGVTFVYDLFAPKMLERLASSPEPATWDVEVAKKERALALADLVWVNGRRKLGYALGWLMRPGVEEQRALLGKPSILASDPAARVSLVEMPVVATSSDTSSEPASGAIQVGIAGYAQHWSRLRNEHPGHRAIVDAGHSLHALLPQHWAAGDTPAAASALPTETIVHRGPLLLEDFHGWVRSMDAMVDVFPQSAERRLAMITRSAVALGWGVPVIHGVDSEIADIIVEYDAGWVETSDDPGRWKAIAEELNDADTLARKREGAERAAAQRFAPQIALRAAAQSLRALT